MKLGYESEFGANLMDATQIAVLLFVLIALSAAAATAEIRDDNLVARVFQFVCLQKWVSTDNYSNIAAQTLSSIIFCL